MHYTVNQDGKMYSIDDNVLQCEPEMGECTLVAIMYYKVNHGWENVLYRR